MVDAFIETPAEPTNDRSQILAAILLGIAATLTAFAAYNASVAAGESLQYHTDSTRALIDANFWYERANAISVEDRLQFVAYLDAAFADNDDLAEYYLSTLMRPEMSEAMEWWDATDEAITPFDEDDGNPYEISEWDEADRLQSDADALAQEGVEADQQSDVFELATVFFALTLFFGGVATLFGKKRVTSALLVMSLIALSLGAVNLVRA